MSELIQKNDDRATIRWKLLTGASALALTAYVSSGSIARAEDAAQPQIWIELGGQLSQLEDGQEIFAPVFPNSPPRPSMFSPSQPFERPPRTSIDEFGKISFQPDGSDWVFSGAIRYGRSTSKRNVHQQTYPRGDKLYFTCSGGRTCSTTFPPYAARSADTSARTSESHLILDFQAGKDVGLGMFGSDSSSVFSIGVRFAQFSTRSNIAIKSDPDWQPSYKYFTASSFIPSHNKIITAQRFHSNAASLRAERKFHGIGPSLSWNASAPFAGNSKDGELSVDWGLNAALLFGRQRTRTHHQTTGQHKTEYGGDYVYAVHNVTFQGPATPDHTRSRSVTVPNVGGFAGVSYRMENFKVSFGYRADMFFGAIDGGIDRRKNENRGFFGPYASISVGLGD